MPAAPPASVAVVRPVSHLMFSVAGMRMRMSFAAVIVGLAASVTVMGLVAVGPSPTS